MKAILWDMDGTLVDTEPRWGEATAALCAEMGREITPAVRERTVGGIAEDTVRICAQWAGLDLAEDRDGGAALRRGVDRLYDLVSVLFAEELPFRPGIPALLAEGARDLPMVVVTNAYRRLTDRALTSIGADLFVGSVCGDEVTCGKPAPDPYLQAAARLGLDPDDCLVVEDSTNGMRSAVAAGCRVLGVPSPANRVPDGAVDVADALPGDGGGNPRTDLGGLALADLRVAWGRIGAVTGDVPE